MSVKMAVAIALVHILYYAYLQLISDIIRASGTTKSQNIEIMKLRNNYNVNIRTFQKNSRLYGFAWFNSMYLNENLLKTKARGKSDLLP